MDFSLNIPIVPSDAAATETILIEACKFDGSVHRSWSAQLIDETADLWTLVGVFADEIRHPLLGVIRPGTISLEYYWKHRYYNVFRFHEPEGELRNFYCNINLPPILREGKLRYVDLDLDVLVQPDLSYRVVDLEEFSENSRTHNYPPAVIEQVDVGLAELINLIENRNFPFDFEI